MDYAKLNHFDTLDRCIIRVSICILYAIAGIAYLSWRLTVFNSDAMLFSTVFYLAELYGFLMSFLILFIAWRPRSRAAIPPAPAGLDVDVFITVYNEPVKIIRRTLAGALRIQYPHETWLLDDGNRLEIKNLAEEFGCHYLAREKNIGAKAGNLNNGLKHAQGDYVAIFDADHVPDPDFLTKLLGYFNDPEIGFVQTPQDYYNSNSFQHGRNQDKSLIWHEQSYFHYVGQTGRDYWNAATLCGCSAVLRRSALDEIGGFPSVTVTEDMHCAVRMQKLGYKTAYHAEPLAFGIAPHDLRGFLRQRLRWGEGNMQVCREEGLPFFCRGLTIPQRLCYFALTSTYFDGWQKLVYYMAPIYVLFSQIPPIWSELHIFAMFFIPYLLLTVFYYEETGRGYGLMLMTEKYAMARFAIAIMATFGAFRKHIGFRVTSKELVGELPIFLLLPHITIFLLGIAALLFTAFRPVLGIELYMPPGITLLLVLFTLVNTVLAGLVIKDSVRSARLKETDYQFKIPLPIRFGEYHHEPHLGVVQEISSTHVIFTTYFPILLKDNATLSGEIYLPHYSLPFRAHLEALDIFPSEGSARQASRVKCRFEWQDRINCDLLDLALISCKWHRAILGKTEQVMTPFDVFIPDKKKGKSGLFSYTDVWQPMLYRFYADNKSRFRLGFMSTKTSVQDLVLLRVFESLPEGVLINGYLFNEWKMQPITGQLLGHASKNSQYQNKLTNPPIYDYFFLQKSSDKSEHKNESIKAGEE